MEPKQDETKAMQSEHDISDAALAGSLPSPGPFKNRVLEKLLNRKLTSEEVELLQQFNSLTSSEILRESRLPENGAPTYRELAELLGSSHPTIQRVTNGTRDASEELVLTLRSKLLEHLRQEDDKILDSSHEETTAQRKKQGVEPNQLGTKAEQVEQGALETEVEGSLPRAEPVFEGKLNLFSEPLTPRELSLLQAFNELDSAEVLSQLKKHGISNKEVARRLGMNDSSQISKVVNGNAALSPERRREVRRIALKEKEKGL